MLIDITARNSPRNTSAVASRALRLTNKKEKRCLAAEKTLNYRLPIPGIIRYHSRSETPSPFREVQSLLDQSSPPQAFTPNPSMAKKTKEQTAEKESKEDENHSSICGSGPFPV